MCFFLHLPTLRACALEKMWHKAFSFGEDILVDSSQGDFCQTGSVSISQTVHSWGGYHYTTPLVSKHSWVELPPSVDICRIVKALSQPAMLVYWRTFRATAWPKPTNLNGSVPRSEKLSIKNEGWACRIQTMVDHSEDNLCHLLASGWWLRISNPESPNRCQPGMEPS